jgi:hypothetical protein
LQSGAKESEWRREKRQEAQGIVKCVPHILTIRARGEKTRAKRVQRMLQNGWNRSARGKGETKMQLLDNNGGWGYNCKINRGNGKGLTEGRRVRDDGFRDKKLASGWRN